MSNDKGTNREGLLRTLALVRPALAAQAYIPALTHIRFNGAIATAYNDVSAISVGCRLDLHKCVPGDLFIRALGTFGGETVLIQEGAAGSIVVSSGRNKVTLPTLPNDQFPMELPEGKAPELTLTDDILGAIERCLMSVGSNRAYPAAMGVTLEADKRGRAILHSTDNYTLSRARTKAEVELPGDVPVILPTFFCEQLVRLHAAFPKAEVVLQIYPGALIADVGNGDAMLLSRVLVDLEPLDFPRTVSRMCGDDADLDESLQDIPAGFDAAVDRALLVLSQEVAKKTEVEIASKFFAMRSESSFGVADDRLDYADGGSSPASFFVDPMLLARGAKACSRMAFLPRCLVMADEKGDFLHLIAHVSG